jgi:hypothetical protein
MHRRRDLVEYGIQSLMQPPPGGETAARWGSLPYVVMPHPRRASACRLSVRGPIQKNGQRQDSGAQITPHQRVRTSFVADRAVWAGLPLQIAAPQNGSHRRPPKLRESSRLRDLNPMNPAVQKW